MADANCKFLVIDVGARGKQSDGGVFRGSDLYQHLENNAFNCPQQSKLPNYSKDVSLPFVILGDEAYPLLGYLMRPYPKRDLTHQKRIFNYRLSRARRCVECAFGIMSGKFRVMTKAMETSVDNAVIITKAVCILHNMIIEEEGVATNTADDMIETNDALHTSDSVDRGATKLAKNIRDSFTEYFCSDEGAVPWQNYVTL